MNSLPVRVYTHPRSGTHFAMATLAQNFDFGADLTSEVDSGGLAWYTTGNQRASVPWGRLFGGHAPWSAAIDPTRVLYVLRHPVDCLYSCWRVWAPGSPVDAFMTEARIRFWRDHVGGYLAAGCYAVRYDKLRQSPQGTLADIERRFCLTRRHPEFISLPCKVGWSPGEAADRYAPRLQPETRARFREILGDSLHGFNLSEDALLNS